MGSCCVGEASPKRESSFMLEVKKAELNASLRSQTNSRFLFNHDDSVNEFGLVIVPQQESRERVLGNLDLDISEIR